MVDRFLQNGVLCETVFYETQSKYKKGIRFQNLLKTYFCVNNCNFLPSLLVTIERIRLNGIINIRLIVTIL